MKSLLLRKYPDALRILQEMEEWMACGFYEAIDLPWPRAHGRAFRRLYENMEVNIPDSRLLVPCAPFADNLICSFQYWTGLMIVEDLSKKKAVYPPPVSGVTVTGSGGSSRKKTIYPVDFIDDMSADLKTLLPHFGGWTHSNPDIGRVLAEGFDGMEHELDEQLASVSNLGEKADQGELNLLLSLKDYTTGVRSFHGRIVAALDKKLKNTSTPNIKELRIISENFKRCFLSPSKNFVQGFLAVNMTWMLDGCDSIGRIDQALGPLFEKDIKDGSLDIDFARKLIDEFFANFENYNGWNLQIGGCKPDGTDGYNLLTREFILACRRNRFRRPNVAFRITKGTPDNVLTETMEVLSEGSGRPALYNDDLYVKRLLEIAPDLGLTPEDARDYGFGGCTETMIPGRSNIGSTEGIINLAKAVELALHDGFDPVAQQQVGIHTGRFDDFARFEDFMDAVKRQIQFIQAGIAVNLYQDHRRRFTEGDPKLYRTFFTRDCVKRRKSFEAGGARYNGTCLIYEGAANLIDSLAAIKKCIFNDKSVTATGLLEALENDFVGHENLHRKLLAAPKFGNDDPYVDDIGHEIMKFAFEDLYSQPHARGGRYLPHSAVFTTYGEQGSNVGALPDGRKKGAVLSDSTGPAQGRDTHGPTAMLKSVARLPLSLAIGTTVLNIRFQKKMLSTKKGLEACVKLIRTFFDLGGMQIQVSVISTEEMLAAQKEPKKNKDVIVRIGGYSEYFVNLDRALQDSVIARTEHNA